MGDEGRHIGLEKGDYCYSQWYKVSKGHNRKMCNCHSTNQNDVTTRSEPMGSSTTKKVWDSWDIGLDVLENKTKINCPHNYFSYLLLLSSCSRPENSPTTSPLVPTTSIPLRDTGIINTGASGIYFTKDAPVTDVYPNAPKIHVGTASEKSNAPHPADASVYQPYPKRLSTEKSFPDSFTC